jgi:NAD-dependent SIR2 family protein deacetylase
METGSGVTAYCVKCKSKRDMTHVTNVKMKNGRPAKTGSCEVCGTKMFRIGK